MPTKRRAVGRNTRRNRATSKGKLRPASEIRGRDVVSNSRRKIARGASKVHPRLNRELV